MMDGKRILLVEDNPANQMVFRDLLEHMGHEVWLVDRAEEGTELARARRPDLILMDIQLPGMDGLTATQILREDELTRDIPIVALTSHAMTGDREKALVAGCNAYITKPIRVESFRREISAILDGASTSGTAGKGREETES